jgi:hypothetical protein
MPLVLKMSVSQQRSLCVPQVAKKGYVTAVQRAFCTQFHPDGWSKEIAVRLAVRVRI